MSRNQSNDEENTSNHRLFNMQHEKFRAEYNRLSGIGSWGVGIGLGGITATILSGGGLGSPVLAFALGALACGAHNNHKAEEYWENNWQPGL